MCLIKVLAPIASKRRPIFPDSEIRHSMFDVYESFNVNFGRSLVIWKLSDHIIQNPREHRKNTCIMMYATIPMFLSRMSRTNISDPTVVLSSHSQSCVNTLVSRNRMVSYEWLYGIYIILVSIATFPSQLIQPLLWTADYCYIINTCWPNECFRF